MTNIQVGAWVRARREALKLGIADVTGPGKLARQTWYDLESGAHPPMTTTQRKVAEALNVQVDWYDLLLAGGAPADEEISSHDEVAALRSMVGDLSKQVADLAKQVATLGDEARQQRTSPGRRASGSL